MNIFSSVFHTHVLLLTRFHHVHVSLLFLFISPYVCNDLSEIKDMFCCSERERNAGISNLAPLSKEAES